MAKDVCEALGLDDHKVAVRKLDSDEVCSIPLTDALGRIQETLAISESGLYALVLRYRDAMTPGSTATSMSPRFLAEQCDDVK